MVRLHGPWCKPAMRQTCGLYKFQEMCPQALPMDIHLIDAHSWYLIVGPTVHFLEISLEDIVQHWTWSSGCVSTTLKVCGCYSIRFFMYSNLLLLDNTTKLILYQQFYDETYAKTGLKIGPPLISIKIIGSACLLIS